MKKYIERVQDIFILYKNITNINFIIQHQILYLCPVFL